MTLSLPQRLIIKFLAAHTKGDIFIFSYFYRFPFPKSEHFFSFILATQFFSSLFQTEFDFPSEIALLIHFLDTFLHYFGASMQSQRFSDFISLISTDPAMVFH